MKFVFLLSLIVQSALSCPEPDRPWEFFDIIHPSLINGTIVDKEMYPATIWIGNCTASVVGPKAVYTAAHCVERQTTSFKIKSGTYQLKCVRSPRYLGQGGRRDPTADYALCSSDKEITGIPYENVNLDPTHVVEKQWILQCGYGCTKWGARLDMNLRVGRSQVLATPNRGSNDYVTGNGAVLCSGDSGGPAWSMNADGSRDRLISVNSRSNTTSRSYLSAIATEEGIRFTQEFSSKYPICGVSVAVTGCRNAKPKAPVTFKLESSQLVLKVVVDPSAKYSAEDAQFALQAALNSLEK